MPEISKIHQKRQDIINQFMKEDPYLNSLKHESEFLTRTEWDDEVYFVKNQILKI